MATYYLMMASRLENLGGIDMKKAELVQAILEDMYAKNPNSSQKTIDLTWKRWLSRQHKFYLEQILNDRRAQA